MTDYNFAMEIDGTLYFFGFELFETHIAIPKSSGNIISFRCIPKSEARMEECIEIKGGKSDSPALLDYFVSHDALGKHFVLVENTYLKTNIKLPEKEMSEFFTGR